MAEHVTSNERVFISDIYADLNIFTWVGSLDNLVLTVKQMHDLSKRTVWHHSEFISKSDSSILYLSVHYESLVLHFIQYWNSQWSTWVPWLEFNLIKNFHESWSRVPGAGLACRLNDIGACESGHFEGSKRTVDAAEVACRHRVGGDGLGEAATVPATSTPRACQPAKRVWRLARTPRARAA